MQKERTDGIVYETREPKMRVKDKWQIELGIMASINRSDFANNKEYRAYVKEHTDYELAEQKSRLERAYADMNKVRTE